MNQEFPKDQLEVTSGVITPKKYSCLECRNGAGLGFQFTMAFQPIIDSTRKEIYSQEALVRGVNQESAYEILSRITDSNRYQFDQACRVKAIELASRLKINSYLNINFLPNAIYQPESCIRTTFEACKAFNFPPNKVIFEITEGEEVKDHEHVINIFKSYKSMGFLTAIDDFGAGYSGLNLLAKFQPDIIKLDMELIREIDKKKVTQIIVKAIMMACNELNIGVIAEGIETIEEYKTLQDLGIRYYQGYLFGKPSWENLTSVNYV